MKSSGFIFLGLGHLILDGLDLLYCRRHLEDECGAKYEGIEVYFRAIILRFQSIRDT